MSKNKIRTPGYFIKRLKDNGFIVLKVFSIYNKADPRRWTVLVNPSEVSVYITCFNDGSDNNATCFEFNDGGNRFPRNLTLKTESIETVVDYLLKYGASCNKDYPGRCRFVSKRINNNDEEGKPERVKG
jgi:hypothetical protein